MISASLRSLAVFATLLLAAPDPLAELGWVWPVERVQVVRAYEAPVHAYGPGHRGIDLASGEIVRSPADGRVAYAGEVAGRPVVTIDHGGGLVTTLEPVASDLAVGDVVARAAPVGRLAEGGHTAPGTLHFGVRLDGEYINPLRLLGGVPRAVLLPCCRRSPDRRAPHRMTCRPRSRPCEVISGSCCRCPTRPPSPLRLRNGRRCRVRGR